LAVALETRRLPGIRFERQAPRPVEILPRMDIAAFVGFAASGPLNVPVAVKDAAQFADVFGEDAPLLWDERRGAQINAFLAPAVRAFFRNGGRRCYVVRVADEAAAVYGLHPVPGLAMRGRDGAVRPAVLRARSQGSWSDSLRVAAALSTRALAVTKADRAKRLLEVETAPADGVLPGELIRIASTSGDVAFLPVTKVGGNTVEWDGEAALFVRQLELSLETKVEAAFTTARGASVHGQALVAHEAYDPPGRLRVNVHAHADDAPAPGTVVELRRGSQQGWLVVDEVRAPSRATRERPFQLAGAAWWEDRRARPATFGRNVRVERLSLELWVRRGSESETRLLELAFAPPHDRFLGDLPTDEDVHAPELGEQRRAGGVWAAAAHPRFPLAGPGEPTVFYPLGVSALPDRHLAPLAQRGTPLERDGLARLHSSIFLDEALAATATESLAGQAAFLRYGSSEPRRLKGIHTLLLDVDEATVVAVPDAVHAGWEPVRHEAVHRAGASAALADLEASRSEFVDCRRRLVPPPHLVSTDPDDTGSYSLTWESEAPAGAEFVLEEGVDREWKAVEEVYRGTRTRIELYGRPRGAYYYRVRVDAGAVQSEWSHGVVVAVSPPAQWQSSPPEAVAGTLLAVQRALLRVCAARGDLLAVLALPAHAREDDALAHVAALAARSFVQKIPGLGAGEEAALSYGAVYHPWLTSSESDRLDAFRFTPPDGAVCGVLARRAVTRGAWVAAANEALRDVVQLTPSIGRDGLARLQDAQINAIRHAPGGFLLFSEDTLSLDRELRPINVRRLLALLRRLALLHGARFAFEPNSDAFRRRVQRGFSEVLSLLYGLGAFRGDTPDEAFRVVADDTVNRPVDVDAGRLTVELRVAPSLPLAFITVRLVHTEQRGFVVEGR
jgi:hypothetical protein